MLEALIVRWGYMAVVVGTFFEGEAILIAGGALAHRGLLSLPLVMVAAFVGSVLGDQLWFQLGRRFGRPLLERRPAWKSRADAVEAQVERYGSAFVIGFRFIYGVRAITPALLGISRYSVAWFTFLNLVGAAVWAAAVGGIGYGLGAALASVLQRAVRVEESLVAGAALTVVGWLIWRVIRRRVIPPKDSGG